MQVLAATLCVFLITTRIFTVLGLEDEFMQEREIENQLADQKVDQVRQIQYDEYPVIVPKRAALLLDRIMVALQKALEDEQIPAAASGSSRNSPAKSIQPPLLPLPRISPRDDIDSNMYLKMDPTNVGLQRRGHTNNNNSSPKGRVWRCYFNAVTCFKKK